MRLLLVSQRDKKTIFAISWNYEDICEDGDDGGGDDWLLWVFWFWDGEDDGCDVSGRWWWWRYVPWRWSKGVMEWSDVEYSWVFFKSVSPSKKQ